ncbi:MAG: hypothetical protein JST84_00080 [Acidobacteria bacterium]|nr:hypothetical protein [Acidobacteriota bacterium]
MITRLGLVIFIFILGIFPQRLLSQAVPLPPSQLADRFGIYNWGIDYSSYPGGELDRLNWGAEKVASLSTRTIRVALPGNIYLVNTPEAKTLAQMAATPAYDKLFRDARFQTYLLTAYSLSDLVNPWADGFTEIEYQATRKEFMEFGDYLLTNPRLAGKTFILLNWEADNAIEKFANKTSIWDSFTRWIQARADGVRDAQLRNPRSSVKLFSGFEFNFIARNGQACGTSVTNPSQEDMLKHRCAIDYVAPRVKVDYYSLSAWLTMDIKLRQGSAASYKDALRTDLNFALAKVRTLRPEIQEPNFIIGEFGVHRTRWGETTAANYVNEMFDAVIAPDAFQVSYAIFWQIIDNLPAFAIGESGFGLYRSRNGQMNLTRAGHVFQQRMTGQPVASFLGGPGIRKTPAPGVLDATDNTTNYRLNPDSILAIYMQACCQIYATPFSPEGNQITLEQGIRQYLLPTDNPSWFYESPTQINVSLPIGRRPGAALLSVTDQNGLESNAAAIVLQCAVCPKVHKLIDRDFKVEEYYPNTNITIFGEQFSAFGNTVTIEQLDDQFVLRKYVLPRSFITSESTTQINTRLPAGLLLHRPAIIIITDNNGRESNEHIFNVAPQCISCAPVLRSEQAILDRDGKSTDFTPGTMISIWGTRFSAAGNQVVIQQAHQSFTMSQGNGWKESQTQLSTALPQALSPGRALIYVIDAQGRESRATTIMINRITQRDRPLGKRTVDDQRNRQ